MKLNHSLRGKVKTFEFILLSLIFFACAKEHTPVIEDAGDKILQIPEGFPQMPFPEDNNFTEARWLLGKKLFYDPILSIDGTLSCSSCHKAQLAFADDRAFSPGVMNRPGVRNAPSLANIGYHPYFLREGSVPTLEMQALVPVQEENEFAHSMPEIARLLQNNKDYVKMSYEAYERKPDPYVITRALATFQRSLISGNSPYDQYYYQGEKSALSASAKRGMELFFSNRTNCSSCHGGFNFTDYSFQNNGLDTVYNDPGRKRLTGKVEDEATFKVPSLRNVQLTAPYMHNGRFHTLEEVIEHYNSGGQAYPNKSVLIKPLELSSEERKDMVEFLKSLTDGEFINNSTFR